MDYQFSFRYFSQKFTKPIITNHGVWEIRESILIRLIDEKDHITWGEISPISWFGSETIEQALDFCRQLPQTITKEIIFTIPDKLPACQFAFESALVVKKCTNLNLTYSGLLSAGKSALNQWSSLWKQGYKTVLHVGNLDSYRNIVHASDVASAIHQILKQEKGDSYLICGNESYKMFDLVFRLYFLAGIELIKKETILFEKETGLKVVIMEYTPVGLDSTPINIRGEPKKLKEIGWKPLFSVEDILNELV